MPFARETCQVAGAYRTKCCGIETTYAVGERFPSCPGRGPGCAGRDAYWQLLARGERGPSVPMRPWRKTT